MNRAILKPTTIITTPSGGFGKGSYEDRRAWTPVARPVWPKLLADRDLNHDRMILSCSRHEGRPVRHLWHCRGGRLGRLPRGVLLREPEGEPL